jgi:GT2 family glycosyltransferase
MTKPAREVIVSVVVPTHGRVALLHETLASLQSQTFDAFEVIVTDDSPDAGDRAAIASAVDAYSRSGRLARYHFTSPRLGQARNTNQGLAEARGPLVRVLHSDDLLAPEALACEARLLQDPRLGIEVLFHEVEPFVSRPRLDGAARPWLVQPKHYFREVMHSGTPVPSGLAFTRAALLEVGPMREDFAFLCDWEFVARLVLREHHAYRFLLGLSPGLVGWRTHAESTTGRLWHRHFLEHETFIDEYCGRDRPDDELFPTITARDDFRQAAVRYRYRRLQEDLSRLPAARWVGEAGTIARCMTSPRSLAERFRRPPPRQARGAKACPPDGAHPGRGGHFWASTWLARFATEQGRRHLARRDPGWVQRQLADDEPQGRRARGAACDLPGILEFSPELMATPATHSLRIVADFDNRLVLWPIRRLLAEASRVVVADPNRNAWFERVLHEALLYGAPGATVELRVTDNVHLSGFGAKAEVDRLFPRQFAWQGQDAIGPRAQALRYTRHAPPHASYVAPHTGWTFGMLTSGKRMAHVARFLDSIRRLCPTPWEVVLVAPHPLDLPEDDRVRTVVFTDRDERGWITRKKNLIAAGARYSDLLICHDRFWLDEAFFEDFAHWGFAYGLAAPRVRLPDGRRGLDWAVIGSRNRTWSTGALLPYLSASRHAYNPGGATLVRASFWRDFPWNENLFWNEHEDVELCRRVQEAGHPIRLAASTVIAAEDRWIDENPMLPYCDDMEVLYGEPVSEQRVVFLGQPPITTRPGGGAG